MKKIIANPKIIIIIYILFAILASVQAIVGTKQSHNPSNDGIQYSKYNNYIIFERSHQHLINNQDLYITYPKEHWDLYKYTPTFAVFFGAFATFPDWLGLSLWNILNALLLLFAVYYIPRLSNYQKGIILLLLLMELMTSLQNEQSNGLMAGLIILSYAMLERKKPLGATFASVSSIFIKLFGTVSFALYLLYPHKWKSVLSSLFWIIILSALPLLFIDQEQYRLLLNSYFDLLLNDHSANALTHGQGTVVYGYSVMGWLNSWFSLTIAKSIVVGCGILVFLLPFVNFNALSTARFKYLLLCSILIWVVIFNHKAESPTFVIAMAGCALWFVASKKSPMNIVLFILAFIFTTLSPTDLFPKFLRETYVIPLMLKAVPCILIWFKITYDMLMIKKTDTESTFFGLIEN